MEYQCSICKLHYKSRKLSEECHEWCLRHGSCNLEITKHSVERSSLGKRQ